MTDTPSTPAHNLELPEEERARIRAEMRYAVLVAQDARASEKPKGKVDKMVGFLSNGFVLLIIGSIITSYLVPRFQREYESRLRESTLKQETLTQFLLYSNSIWQEYYAVLPFTLQTDLQRDEYVRSMNEISKIKLNRYDAYAKVQAAALVFRGDVPDKASRVESELEGYAKSVNAASEIIDKWLGDFYCTPVTREMSPCAKFDPTFDAYDGYRSIKRSVEALGNERAQRVAKTMEQSIKGSP